jgi:RNA polymerase primary sigma factor
MGDKRFSEIERDYYSQIAEYPDLTREETSSLFEKYRAGDLSAREKLINHYLRLVVSVVNTKFPNSSSEKMDLIMEGNKGLIKAIEKFDPEKGYALTTYAPWWIKQSIMRFTFADSSKRIPDYLRGLMKRLRESSRDFYQKKGREVSEYELIESYGFSKEEIQRGNSANEQKVSLDYTDEDEKTPYYQNIEDAKGKNPLESLLESDGEITSKELLSILNPTQREIIRVRYELGNKKRCTLDELGKKFNLTRERVRQIEKKALEKMRKELARKGILSLE